MKRQGNTLEKRYVARMAVMALSLLFTLTTLAQQPQRKTLNTHWKFLKGECPAAADSAFDDRTWANIHLPHTWIQASLGGWSWL